MGGELNEESSENIPNDLVATTTVTVPYIKLTSSDSSGSSPASTIFPNTTAEDSSSPKSSPTSSISPTARAVDAMLDKDPPARDSNQLRISEFTQNF